MQRPEVLTFGRPEGHVLSSVAIQNSRKNDGSTESIIVWDLYSMEGRLGIRVKG